MVHENPKRFAKLHSTDKKYCVNSDIQSAGRTNFRSEAPQQHKEKRHNLSTYVRKDLVFEVQPNGMFVSVH